jgi:hypothetical protein
MLLYENRDEAFLERTAADLFGKVLDSRDVLAPNHELQACCQGQRPAKESETPPETQSLGFRRLLFTRRPRGYGSPGLVAKIDRATHELTPFGR